MEAVEELLTRQGGMARRRQLRKVGLSRRRLAAAVACGELRLVLPDLYITADLRPDEALRAAVVRLDGVISHESAALLLGIELVQVPDQPHVTVPRNHARATHTGVRVHRSDIIDVCRIDAVQVTGPVRTLFDLCRSLPLEHAVACVDSALRKGLVTVESLTSALVALPAGRGRQRVTRALSLMDPASGSILESLCRVLMAVTGLPAPRTQHPVRHASHWIGRVDFAWPELRVIVETDGFAFHSSRDSYRKDRRRLNALTVAGWTVVRFSWEDVVHEPDYVVATLSALLVRREAA